MDLIDEEILLQWGERPSKKYVPKELSKLIHSKATPVINWLKEAEEESSEEEEEEEVTKDKRIVVCYLKLV